MNVGCSNLMNEIIVDCHDYPMPIFKINPSTYENELDGVNYQIKCTIK